jgi:hypothetical protein
VQAQYTSETTGNVTLNAKTHGASTGTIRIGSDRTGSVVLSSASNTLDLTKLLTLRMGGKQTE